MTESTSLSPVSVTAEERTHPAISKLARACIALARHQLAATHSAAARPASSEKLTNEEEAASDQEQPHA